MQNLKPSATQNADNDQTSYASTELNIQFPLISLPPHNNTNSSPSAWGVTISVWETTQTKAAASERRLCLGVLLELGEYYLTASPFICSM
jgi:hypothetical protein